MKITFVRHAEIAGDPFICPERPVKGSLSEKGVKQAKLLAKTLKGEKFDLAISSSYGRALQTAEIVLNGRKTPIRICDFMKEWMPDRHLEKLPKTEFEAIQKLASGFHAEETWKTDLGEGCFDMYARICPAFLKELDKIGIHARLGGYVVDKKAKDLSIAVFAHGGSLNVLLSFILELRPFPIGRFAFEQTGYATVKFQECKGISYPTLCFPAPK
ncbi:MAG TPA: hypothetical protein DET40_14235 [Lentisphaeria bacterium]|nr:MAG: hypothetical protein A2X45_20930 [Lentisphaerae bacterium GWF2_50_93]HCE44696.1 hypothetical protein [Lentisphaeria bacterium]